MTVATAKGSGIPGNDRVSGWWAAGKADGKGLTEDVSLVEAVGGDDCVAS